MKRSISIYDCKFTEQKLDEIFAMGGIPSPQDGTFRILKGTIERGYINNLRRLKYEICEGESCFKCTSPEGEILTLQKGTIEERYIEEQKMRGYRVRETRTYIEFVF